MSPGPITRRIKRIAESLSTKNSHFRKDLRTRARRIDGKRCPFTENYDAARPRLQETRSTLTASLPRLVAHRLQVDHLRDLEPRRHTAGHRTQPQHRREVADPPV